MNRDKQIEEMANTYYEAMLKARATLGSMNEGAPKWYATYLYNAGYRKAFEVAREIFEEIEDICDDFPIYGNVNTVILSERDLAFIKKKYTEGNDG